MKKLKRWQKIILALFVLGLAACVWEFFSSQNPWLLSFKRNIKYEVLHLSPENTVHELGGLSGSAEEIVRYVDGAEAEKLDFSADCKKIYYDPDRDVSRVVNYLDGWQLTFPGKVELDQSLSPLFLTVLGEDYDVTISRERAPYQSKKDIITFELSTFLPFFPDHTVQDYIEHYEYRFLLNREWQESNRVYVGQMGELLFHAKVEGLTEGQYDSYLYGAFPTGSREYIRVVWRFHSTANDSFTRLAETLQNDLRCFDPVGEGHYQTDFYPDTSQTNWSAETQAVYDSLQEQSQDPLWGVFMGDFVQNGFHGELPKLEEKLDFHFPVVLYYVHLPSMEFPAELMQEAKDQDRIVELTLQVTDSNNMGLFGPSPQLAIYRGELDETTREFARNVRVLGHTVLFRLGNEMNSDWTSYSGVNNLCDPHIYTAVWQRIYRIFQEEGANNLIWIYNPNDRSAPPAKWNNALAYYPGNEYVHMLGVTGYNNGTYYAYQGETWRSFGEIYDKVQEEYEPHFIRFPWIITEFASSSVGGDKAAWITDMFQRLGDYPNIRIAVWFSAADYDEAGNPARPYWLDETEETLNAFREGLAGKWNL